MALPSLCCVLHVVPANVNVRLAQKFRDAKPLFRFEESEAAEAAAAKQLRTPSASTAAAAAAKDTTFITAPNEIVIGAAPRGDELKTPLSATAQTPSASSAAGAELSDPPPSPPSPTPYVLQGDKSWNSKANRVRRANLRKHPAIAGCIQLYYRLLTLPPAASTSSSAKVPSGLSQAEYTKLHIRMAKALDSTFEEARAIKLVSCLSILFVLH